MDNQNSFNQEPNPVINQSPMNEKHHGGKKSLFIALIIVILTIVALYYMQSMTKNMPTNEINEQIQLQDEQVEIINQQGTSDETVDILNDLQSADVESLDLNLE